MTTSPTDPAPSAGQVHPHAPDAAPSTPPPRPAPANDAGTSRPATPGWSTPAKDDAATASARSVALAVPREAREYQGQRAGVVTRTIANVIDYAVVAGALGCCYLGWAAFLFLLNPVTFSWPTVPFAVVLLAGFVLMVGYFTVSWATGGRTVGDTVMGLRVVNHRGERLRWITSFLRAGFCAVFPLGLAWVLVSPSNRSLQDTVLRTSCIYDWLDRPFSLSSLGARPEG